MTRVGLTQKFFASAAAVTLAGMIAMGSAAARVSVPIDQTKSIDLKDEIATVVLSNPSVADVTVQGPKKLLLLGKTYGTTNLIGLDAHNQPIFSSEITVTSSNRVGDITLYRGASPVSYACAPRCERVLTPGDNNDSFNSLAEQISRRLDISTSGDE